MTPYQQSDIIPFEEFEFTWRISEAKWASVSGEERRRLKPLPAKKSMTIVQASVLQSRCGCPFDIDHYHATKQV